MTNGMLFPKLFMTSTTEMKTRIQRATKPVAPNERVKPERYNPQRTNGIQTSSFEKQEF
jgi:hypothetical protein